MIRSVLFAAAILAAPTLAFADEKRDPRVEAILDELPTRADMENALEDMPDLNVLMTGVMDIAQDPETMDTLERVGARLEQRFADLDIEAADGEMPDLNLLMGEMMGLATDLSTDRETMGDLLGLMFQVVDVVEESVGEQP